VISSMLVVAVRGSQRSAAHAASFARSTRSLARAIRVRASVAARQAARQGSQRPDPSVRRDRTASEDGELEEIRHAPPN
jgi:hypothetical protein